MIRVIVCVIIGVVVISQGINLLHSDSFVNQVLAIPILGMGLLVVIYGFSPRLGKKIIDAIVDIVRIALRS